MLQDAAHTNEDTASASEALPSLSTSLPSLDKPTLSAPKLVMKLNRPAPMHPSVHAWNQLQRIEDIHIQPADMLSNHEPQNAISVFLRHSQSRIPTVNNRASETTSLLGSPTADQFALRSFAELETLRTHVWESIRHSIRQHHQLVFCELCDGLSLLMLTKLSLPALLTMTIHRSQASRAKKMSKFLLRLLYELRENKAHCVPACKGQHDLPLLLHSFIFGDEDTETTDEAAASTSPRAA